MRWIGFRPRTLTTRVGEARLVRGYWHCAACGTGHAPDDVTWDLPPGNASWGVRDGASLLGAVLPSFEHVADLLAEMTLFQVSARSAETWTEEVGAAYAMPNSPPDTARPRADVVIIEADACKTLWRTDHAWHEQKVYAAWGVVDGQEHPVRYTVAQGPWHTHGPLVTALARSVGVQDAREVLCLADGAPAIWTLLSQQFPQAFQLLDWYHLMEHLGAVSAIHPEGADWLAAQQEALRSQGPRQTLCALKRLHQQSDHADLRATAGACLRYMWRHRHRMDYPEARRRGYPIGSGRIESSVKQVVQARAKGPGMSWHPQHLQQVLRARCAVLSGDWPLACSQAKATKRAHAVQSPPKPPAQPVTSRRQRGEREMPKQQDALSVREMAQAVKKAFGF